MNKMNKNFCVMPWIGITSDNEGLVRPCCKYAEKISQDQYPTGSLKENTYEEIWNGENFKKIRQAFLDGKMIPECSSCWKEEAAGLRSLRQIYNDVYPEKKEYTLEADTPKFFDLKLNNICNFKCRMCDYSYSSLILKEDKIFRGYEYDDEDYYISNKILGTENEKYFFEKVLPHLDQIEFTGGEPFVSPESKKIIDIISQSEYAKNIIVLITTNGSILNDSMIRRLLEFKEVKILVSVDDIGKRLEYQRHGANWKTIQKNILKLKSFDKIDLKLHPTINNYNIWDLQELFDWADDNDITVVNNILHGPDWLSIKNLHTKIKIKILDKHGSDPRFKSLIYFMTSDISWGTNFIKETEFLDRIRKESFRDVYPEWSELIYAYM